MCKIPIETRSVNYMVDEPPYSEVDYAEAKGMGLDLDDWKDYCKFYHLGEEEEYE